MRIADDAEFTREYGCTEAEWLRWLPDAVHGHAWRRIGEGGLGDAGGGAAEVRLGEGHLRLAWTVRPERRIALVRLPRLEVRFAFEAVPPAQRAAFLRLFDLHTQRGGG
jgi:hypothetical protein